MGEAAKKILAYQQTPLVLTCEQAGRIPEEFLSTLTEDEKGYVRDRAESPLEEVFYELLPRIQAAGVLPTVSPLLIDVHTVPPRLNQDIDGISLSLAEQRGTDEFLIKEFFHPFVTDLKRVKAKTEQRFGTAHMVHLTVLPRFHEGRLVEDEIVTFGEDSIPGASFGTPAFADLYATALVRKFPVHTWVGVHPKFFSTRTLRQELVERLSRVRSEIVATA